MPKWTSTARTGTLVTLPSPQAHPTVPQDRTVPPLTQEEIESLTSDTYVKMRADGLPSLAEIDRGMKSLEKDWPMQTKQLAEAPSSGCSARWRQRTASSGPAASGFVQESRRSKRRHERQLKRSQKR